MVRMLGDRVLPESVQARRRQVRQRVNSLREPVRSFREEKIPGPDVVGKTERQLSSLRDRFVSRDAVVERVRQIRSDSSSDGSGSGSGSGNGSGSSNTRSSGTQL